MNKIELFFYNRVKNNYVLKNLMRNAYQGFWDLLPSRESVFAATPVVLADSFFGFHDSDPFSPDGTAHLAYRLHIPLRMPGKDDALEVGLWTGEGFRQWQHIGQSHAWNYHKGCRLQWLSPTACIYNTEKDGILCAEISPVTGGEKQHLAWPIDTVSPDGQLATTFSYERLQAMMPGYGYLYGDEDARMDENTPAASGLWLIDVPQNRRSMLVSLQELSQFQHEESMDGGTFHFVTHTEFSPDQRHVAFLHRWYKGTMRKTRLVVMNLESRQMYASPTTGMVSHYHWNGLNGIVAYCRMEGVDSHVYFFSPEMTEWKRCAYPQLNSDGHQHFIGDDWFLVDTYPDKRRHCRLYKVNRLTDEAVLLADVQSPKQFVAPDQEHWWKCDLHPRCSADGRWLSFDSVHTGVRSLCIMPLQQ